jgi:hypothetical protein
MKFLLLALVALTPPAFATYQDGTYNCKNPAKDLPDNIFRIQTTNVNGLSLPTVEVTRYYKKGEGMDTVSIKGLASLHSTSSTNTTLIRVGSLVLEFVNGEFINCKR